MRVTRGHARRKPRYGTIILAALVLVGIIVTARMATAKFEWWKKAAFDGQVVGKEARTRAADEPLDEADALRQPANCRFYLEIRQGEETKVQEVTLSLFRKATPGDRVIKKAGTWQWAIVPGARGGAAGGLDSGEADRDDGR